MDDDKVTVEQEQQVQLSTAETGQAVEGKAGDAPDSTNEAVDSNEKDAEPRGIESLEPGQRLQGKVKNIVDFGAFIDIGVGRDGLAHISTLRQAGIDKTIQKGDAIDVIVRRVDLDRSRISLTIPGASKDDQIPLGDLEVGSVVKGRVVRIVDFGAFVDVGARTDGLLHVSELDSGFVRHPSEVVRPGDQVEVRILDVDAQRRRISLTMKDLGESSALATPEHEQQNAPDEDIPTAFEVAFEEAFAKTRKRRRRSGH